jgi:hypothetical protein
VNIWVLWTQLASVDTDMQATSDLGLQPGDVLEGSTWCVNALARVA